MKKSKKITAMLAASTLAITLSCFSIVNASAEKTATATAETTGRNQYKAANCSLIPDHGVVLLGCVSVDSHNSNCLAYFRASQGGDLALDYCNGSYSFGTAGKETDIAPKTCFNPRCKKAYVQVEEKQTYWFASKKKATVKLYAK